MISALRPKSNLSMLQTIVTAAAATGMSMLNAMKMLTDSYDSRENSAAQRPDPGLISSEVLAVITTT